jgi:DNA replication protein DnaC
VVSGVLAPLPELLGRPQLTAVRDRLDGLLDQAARRELSVAETPALLCEAEVAHREERRIQMGLGIAKFPYVRTLEGFDFAAQPSLDPRQVHDLAACRWVASGDTLLIQGPPGVGKSHLAVALGREAVRRGHSVLFTPAMALIAGLMNGRKGGWRSGSRATPSPSC